jgi:site-specific DNA recombinase
MPNNRKRERSLKVVRVAIYARYSSDLQNSTIEQQIRACREYAAEQDWIILEECIFYDEAKSGQSLAGRDGLDALMARVDRPEPPFDGILIADTSRFGRKLTDTLQMSERLEYRKIFLYFVENELDSRDRNFRQLFIDSGRRDEESVRFIAKKVHTGQRERALNGQLPNGRVFGYDNVPVEDPTRKGKYGRPAVAHVLLVSNPVQAAAVRRIFEMYACGMGHRSIARTLNAARVPSPLQGTGSPIRRAWNAFSVAGILKNEKYRGVNVWNKTKVVRNPYTRQKEQQVRPESEWERIEVPEWRIIPEELWNAVQVENLRRQGPSWWKGGGLNLTEASRKYLFSGLMCCALCGGSFNVVGGKGESARYGCIGHRYRGNCENKVTILRRFLEDRLLTALSNNLGDQALRERLAEEFHQQLSAAWQDRAKQAIMTSSTRPRLCERQKELRRQAENLADAIAATGGSKTLHERIQFVEAELVNIEELLGMPDEPEQQPLPVEAIQEFLERKTADLATLLKEDPEKTKLELRKRITKLMLEPKLTPDGPVYEVTGDVRLLAANETVECEDSSPRNPTLYTSIMIPFNAQISTKGPKARPIAA